MSVTNSQREMILKWHQGKTCAEMAGLHVKVTYDNGTVITTVLAEDGAIRPYDVGARTPISFGAGDDPFVPRQGIKSVESVDDPEYERIEDIYDVKIGDMVCMTEGNRFPVIGIKSDPEGDPLLRIRIREIDEEYHIGSEDFAYALRPKPKLPDKPGLWYDRNDNLWVINADMATAHLLCDGNNICWLTHGMSLPFHDDEFRDFAPFRPAKAVEA